MAEASSEEKKLCNSFQKIKVTEEESDSPALKRLFGEGNKHETSVEILADDDGDVKEHGAEEELDGQENDLCMREYQTELAENAVKGYNTVICAPTGSGKTRVALHIIQEHLQKKEDAKVVFLARTVPLVKQQYSYLQRRLKDKYEVLKVTGGEYGCLEVHGLIKKYDVVVMTPQILLNHLNAVPNSSLKILTLIIFDECHHTQKNEIYNKLMQAYHKTKEETGGEKLPQIVGLTASFGIGNATTNVEGAYMNIVNICGNLDVTKISTETKHVDEMLKHSPVPVEETVDLKPRESDNFVASMNSCMEDIENKIKGIAKRNGWEAVLKGLQYVPGDRKLQAYRQRIVILKQVAEEHIKPQDDNIKDKILLISLAELLCVCSNALELYDLADIKEVQTFLQEESMDLPNEFLNKLLQMDPSSPVSRNKNLQNLEKVLLEYLVAKGPSSRCIIFVRTRALARLLADSLNSCSSSVHHLNAAVFTGTSTAKESGVKAQRRQEKLLQDFLEGEVKVLVATTVAEEGLDIPSCNLVIMYNHLGNEVSRIQKMGRCRQADGVSVLMAMPKDKPRDYLNRVKAGLVNSALKTIQNKGKDFQERVEQYMQSNLALTTARPSTQLNQTVLEFECKRCHRLAVESCDLRIISKHHRAVVNGDILDNIIVKYKAPKEYVQLRSIASVHCKNKGCENAIGTLYIYERTPFVVLQRKNLSCPRLGKPKWTWEDVKRIGCLCADIQSQDIKEYLSGKCDQWYECEPTSVSAAKRRKLSAGSQPLPTPESDTRQAEERAANLNLAATTKAADSGTEDVKMAEELTEEDEERLLGEPTDFNTTAIGEIFEDLDEKADKFLGEAPDLESLSMNVPSDSGPNQSYNCEVPENTESSLSLLISH